MHAIANWWLLRLILLRTLSAQSPYHDCRAHRRAASCGDRPAMLLAHLRGRVFDHEQEVSDRDTWRSRQRAQSTGFQAMSRMRRQTAHATRLIGRKCFAVGARWPS